MAEKPPELPPIDYDKITPSDEQAFDTAKRALNAAFGDISVRVRTEGDAYGWTPEQRQFTEILYARQAMLELPLLTALRLLWKSDG